MFVCEQHPNLLIPFQVLAEILIHRSLSHPNIIKFHDLFQDEENMYFKLELCSNGVRYNPVFFSIRGRVFTLISLSLSRQSMNDMIRTRGRCLDEEARFYMVQLLAACQYMHNNHVIHRDLKLGNIMLDPNMNIKVGDFGLAALLKDAEERKKTMCGTPNYIAPEILYQIDGSGHSFEVDVWSVGVILYTLLMGKPPFQTTSVSGIYEKIRKNEYSIPEYIHPAAADLIKRILTPDPSARPTLMQIMHHPWFTCAPIPLFIPSSGTKMVPYLTLPQTEAESRRNLQKVKELSGWRDDADDEVEEEEMTEEQRKLTAKEKRRAQEKAEEERERMDQEFERAIQPGSSLAAFLAMGRQALSKAPAQTSAPLRPKASTGLARQLSALTISRQYQSQGGGGGVATSNGKGHVEDASSTNEMADKENIQQARMMPPPISSSSSSSGRHRTEITGAEERRMLGQKARLVAAMSASASSASLSSTISTTTTTTTCKDSTVSKRALTTSSIDLVIQYLGEGLESYLSKIEFIPLDLQGNEIQIPCFDQPDDLNPIRERPENPSSYIVCWMDEMDKYGLGYALSDGTVGAYLKDDSSIMANAQRSHFDHISKLRSSRSINNLQAMVATSGGNAQKRENFEVPDMQQEKTSSSSSAAAAASAIPKDILRKFKILSYFEDKIATRLGGLEVSQSQLDASPMTGMTFVWKWYRSLQAIVFRLSNNVIQFNFYDHTKVFFSQDGLVVSAIITDRAGEVQSMRSWTLTEFFSIADKTRSQREQEPTSGLALTTHEERKIVRSLVSKVKYARETLVKISTKEPSTNSTILTNNTISAAAPSRTSTTRSIAKTLGHAVSNASLGPSTLIRSGSAQSLESVSSASTRRS